jgi:hypothetical protein
LLFALLSLVLTYPLALHLADAVEDRQDALLNVWITAWDGHQLLNDPLHLFDANIFAPYPRTLAYSELLLGNGLLALPITAATGNPVLGYNVALLLSFVLSGFGTYLLVLKLTRSPGAGMVAGVIFAFSSYRMTNLAQAQLLTTQWMPFALLALVLLMRQPRARHIINSVLFFCLQALSSFYYAILLALAVLAFVLWELVLGDFGIRHRGKVGLKGWFGAQREVLLSLLVAAFCCAAIVLPFALPYFQVQRELGFERALADNEPFSASLRQYLMVPPGSVLHGRWLPSDETPIAGGYPVDALFPGVVALLLAAWGLVRGRDRSRWFYLLLLLASVLLSLGPRLYLAPGRAAGLEITLPYAWLYTLVPGFKALRAPVRFDALAMLALAVLAGYGVEALARGLEGWRREEEPATGNVQSRRWNWLAAGSILLIVGLVALESLAWPAARAEPVPVGDEVPPVYAWLAGQDSSDPLSSRWRPVLELPMAFTSGGPQLEYQYFSTYHWQTTPDGYSGFIPPKHGQIVYEMERFPSERAVSLLQALGVHDVIIHTDRHSDARWSEMQAELSQSVDLAPAGAFASDQVYEVQARAFDPRSLEVSVYLPPRAAAGEPYTAYLIALNQDTRSYAIQPTEEIKPAVSWQGMGGESTERPAGNVPLVTSPDGGVAIVPLSLTAPTTPGTYRVVIREQGGALGTWALGGSVEVGEEGDNAFPVPARLEAWALLPTVRAGEPLTVGLTWRALGKIDAYYSTYVKLLDGQGNAIAGWDGQPRGGEAPTLGWVPGETIDDVITFMVPPDAAPGDYLVEVGMYRAGDLARCLTLDRNGVPLERVVLGIVRVEP